MSLRVNCAKDACTNYTAQIRHDISMALLNEGKDCENGCEKYLEWYLHGEQSQFFPGRFYG